MPKEPSQSWRMLEAVQRGEPDAARQVVERFGEHILIVIRRRINPEIRRLIDPEDIRQEVWREFFERAMKGQRFEDSEQLVRWLAAMAANKTREANRYWLDIQKRCLKRLRDRCSRRPLPTIEHLCSSINDETVQREEWEEILKGVPEETRQIVWMTLEGWTQAEIGERLGISERTVRRRLEALYHDWRPS